MESFLIYDSTVFELFAIFLHCFFQKLGIIAEIWYIENIKSKLKR